MSGAEVKSKPAQTVVTYTAAGEWQRRLVRSKSFWCGAAIILIAVAIMILFLLMRTTTKSLSVEKVIPAQSEAQAAASQLAEAKAKQPAASASTADKAAYYDKLMFVSANDGDYKDAVAAFKQKEALGGSVMTYMNYYDVAQYYHQLKDNADALTALDGAEQLLPAQDDPTTGYVRADTLSAIATLRQEYSS